MTVGHASHGLVKSCDQNYQKYIKKKVAIRRNRGYNFDRRSLSGWTTPIS